MIRNDGVSMRIKYWAERVKRVKDAGHYFWNQPASETIGGARVVVHGREMLNFASYSYLGLIGHPLIIKAAKAAIDKYGSGTHGVRILAGSLDLHEELEQTIADFKQVEAAITFSRGYATNLAAVSSLVGRHDAVICDKYDHASIIDGCLLAGAELRRFRHNDMSHLKHLLKRYRERNTRLVIVDSVFSTGGDIIDLPKTVELCRDHGAWLMVDEAHSIGVLGKTGRGIEEHFGLGRNAVDVKMGSLSKAIASMGGYLGGRRELVNVFRHSARAYIYSASLPPAQAAAAKAAFEVIRDEPRRITRVQQNAEHFIRGLREIGFDTMLTETAIVPILCGSDEKAYEMTEACQEQGIFVLPVIAPVVPAGLARLRATVTAVHTTQDIELALGAFEAAGKHVGLI